MRALAIVVAVVLTAVLVAELGAEWIATRVVADRAAGRVVFDELEVTSVGRPATPGLLLGRLHDVELVGRGIVVEDLRIDHASAAADEVFLPWGSGAGQPVELTARLTIVEPDLRDALAERVPGPIDPVLELEPGAVALGIDPLPARLRAEVSVHDGRLRLVPAASVPAWFASLGLQLEFDLPDGLDVDHIEVEEGRMLVDLQLEIMLDGDGDGVRDGVGVRDAL